MRPLCAKAATLQYRVPRGREDSLFHPCRQDMAEIVAVLALLLVVLEEEEEEEEEFAAVAVVVAAVASFSPHS